MAVCFRVLIKLRAKIKIEHDRPTNINAGNGRICPMRVQSKTLIRKKEKKVCKVDEEFNFYSVHDRKSNANKKKKLFSAKFGKNILTNSNWKLYSLA